jgi:hypothetical protein
MKINEITNAQDQLVLLRTIMDNTWSAIRQQADAQTTQRTNQTKTPKPKLPKRVPMAPAPKPLPKSKPVPLPPQQIKNQQTFAGQNQKMPVKKQLTPMPDSLKPLPYSIISPTNQNRNERERQEILKQARGETPWKPL